MLLTLAQLDGLKALAIRDHCGTVEVEPCRHDGLEYVEVSVLLTDMGDKPPLHTFLLTPRGVLKSA